MSRSPAVKRVNKWSRKLHRWGAILSLVPVLVILVTGLLLQLKKHWAWVQPPTVKGQASEPTVSLEQILAAAISVERAAVRSWADIDRIDLRPGDGVAKVRAESGWEVQVDTATGDVLQTAYRRSDLIESIHDGSILGDPVKLGVFLPAAVFLLGLWVTGAYLWVLPITAKRSGRRRRATAPPPGPAAR